MTYSLLIITLIFILGTLFGSFLYCFVYRTVNNLSIIKGRSRCDYCGHKLGVLDLIPVISFILNKGKCRYCKHQLDIKYLISELVTGLVYLFLYIKYGLTLNYFMYLIVTSIMITISFIDYQLCIIPDKLIICLLINMLIFKTNRLESLFNGLVISLFLFIMRCIMNKILNKESMGFGDIKLFFVLGTYLSLHDNLISLLLSCIVGIVFVILMKKKEFPFGPSICISYFLIFMLV